jgi:hypothetical protein
MLAWKSGKYSFQQRRRRQQQQQQQQKRKRKKKGEGDHIPQLSDFLTNKSSYHQNIKLCMTCRWTDMRQH